ncbi:MAG: hypothetical protein K2L87_06855 [Clostridiales bacterium]|nr:hypothetical protein [Clostridiales bacterium]
MNPVSLLMERLRCMLTRKKTMIIFVVLFLFGAICGMIFIKTPAVYGYHLKMCDRFVERVCFSSQNVFLIMLERAAGHALYLIIILAAGISPFLLVLTPVIWVYRAYTFGGSIVMLFAVYRFTGALLVFGLYLPIHLLIDAVLLCAISLSFSRARGFCFCRREHRELALDLLILFALIVLICILEMFLLLMFFHSPGNIT